MFVNFKLTKCFITLQLFKIDDSDLIDFNSLLLEFISWL
jgi:hypothetical protein